MRGTIRRAWRTRLSWLAAFLVSAIAAAVGLLASTIGAEAVGCVIGDGSTYP